MSYSYSCNVIVQYLSYSYSWYDIHTLYVVFIQLVCHTYFIWRIHTAGMTYILYMSYSYSWYVIGTLSGVFIHLVRHTYIICGIHTTIQERLGYLTLIHLYITIICLLDCVSESIKCTAMHQYNGLQNMLCRSYEIKKNLPWSRSLKLTVLY